MQRSKGLKLSSQTKFNLQCCFPSVFSCSLSYSTAIFFFFGFGDKKCKGVAYQVWRFEVESVIQRNLLSHEVIAAQIRKSLQREVKTKIIGFGPRMSVERILGQLDQFYGDGGAAMGDELLSQAYSFRQQEGAIKIDKQRTTVPSYSPMKSL